MFVGKDELIRIIKPKSKGKGEKSDKLEEMDKSDIDTEEEKEEEKKEGEGKDKEKKSKKKESDKSKDKSSKEKGEGEGAKGDLPDEVMQTEEVSDEQLRKEAEELYDSLQNAHQSKKGCGSPEKGKEKQGELDDYATSEAQSAIDEIENAINENAPKDHPFNTGGMGGEKRVGKKQKADTNILIAPAKRVPKWMRYVQTFAKKTFVKKKMRGGFDVIWSEELSIPIKDKPKMPRREKYIYVLADVSGSMIGGSDYADSLIGRLVAVLPSIAQEFDGEVWWCSAGIMYDHDGNMSKTPLKEFKKADGKKINEIITKDATVFSDFGGGSSHDIPYVDFTIFREKENTDAAVIVFTDGAQSTEKIMPNNCVIVTNTRNVATISKQYAQFYNDPKYNFHVVSYEE